MMAECVEIIHFNQFVKWIKKETLVRTERLFGPLQVTYRNKEGV